MRHLRYIVTILMLSFILGSVVAAEDARGGNDASVVGTIIDAEPARYAVAITDGRKKRLYTKGDIFCSNADITNCLRIKDIKKDMLILTGVNSEENYTVKAGERIPLEGTEIIFEKTVESAVLEYRYKDSRESGKGGAEDFIVMDMEGDRIVLGKAYDRGALLKDLPDEEREMFKSPRTGNSDSKKIKAGLFENIKIEKVGRDAWAVDKKSAAEAISNTEETLVSVIKGVRPQFRFGEGPSLKFNCELGDVVLNREGFLVQNLAVAALAERTGIKQGDLIKGINGRPVNTLYGIFKVCMDLKSDRNIKALNVDIVREGKAKTLVYNIK